MKKRAKNHYDTLEVKRDASQEEIKQAYRRKARKAHPDKGGDAEHMAEINRAYEVLANPGRRLLYDQTGEDERQTLNEQIQNELLSAFNDALQKDAHHILNHVKKLLNSKLNQVKTQKSQMKAAKKKLLAKREKISTTTGENLFHLLVDQQVRNIDNAVASMEHVIKGLNATLKLLDNYESSEEEAVATMTIFISGGSAATGGSW